MNCLILFCGTKSFSKVLNEKKKCNVRTLDIEKKYNPYYCVDILEWDYKNDLKNFKVDFLHSSPVCKYFSKILNSNKKNVKKNVSNINNGFKLIDKTLEIIEWIKKNQNPDLKFTIENPKRSITLKYEPLKKYDYKFTSYCRYGFLYQKNTTFWYGGFDLKLKERCKNTKDKSNWCKSKLKYTAHRVRIGLGHKKDVGTYKRTNKNQIGDVEYFKKLKLSDDTGIYDNMSITEFRYRIPRKLIEDIFKSAEID